MSKKINFSLVLALIFGIFSGIFLPEFSQGISFIGTIYINILKFIIIPVVFISMSLSIYKTKKSKTKLFAKTVLLFLLMFIFSFLISSLLFALIKPFSGLRLTDLQLVSWTEETVSLKLSDIIVALFPSNIATMLFENAIFASIVFAIVFGLSASKVKTGKVAMQVIESLKDIFNGIIEYITYLTPLAVFALVSSTVASYGSTIVGVAAKYIAFAYFLTIVIMFLVMFVPVWIYAKISPLNYIKKLYKIWLISTSTCSSAATMPHTIKLCNEEFNVPEKITNLVVPLGSIIHMCGGAVSFSLLILFTSSIFGIGISLGTYLLMLITATAINMAAPGIPNGGVVLGATYLSLFNLPLSFMGIYSGMYRLLDMAYTTLNVTGDISANILLDQYEKNKKIK